MAHLGRFRALAVAGAIAIGGLAWHPGGTTQVMAACLPIGPFSSVATPAINCPTPPPVPNEDVEEYSYNGSVGSGWTSGSAECADADLSETYAYATSELFFNWVDTTEYHNGNPASEYVNPFQVDSFLYDTNHQVSDACGPFVWTGNVQFSDGSTSYLTHGTADCWFYTYDSANEDAFG